MTMLGVPRNSSNKALVPTTYDRFAYNKVWGVETRHHTDRLTAQEARAINNTFNIFIVPVRHGYGLNEDPHALENGNAPSEDDFNYIDKLIEHMEPGDELLVEGVGFDNEKAAHHYLTAETVEALGRIKNNTAGPSDFKELLEAKEELFLDRKNYRVDVIVYGATLALLRGIEATFADMDSYDESRFSGIIGERDEVGMPIDEDDLELGLSIRDKKAVNTVKDRALEKIEEGVGSGEVRKSKLVLLYGSGHTKGLKDRFDTLGIEVMTLAEVEDDPIKRHAGHLALTLSK